MGLAGDDTHGTVLGLLIWVGIVLFQRAFSAGGGASSTVGESALELLKKRYAAGEIGKEEYEVKRRDLE